MLINATTLSAVFVNLKTTFNKAFGAAPTIWAKIATKVPSTGSENQYAWVDGFPRMKKWIGEKALKSLKGSKYTVTNDDFEATVEVDRNHIEDDQLGIYGPIAEMAAQSSAQLPDELVIALVNQSFANLCFDGQYFIDIDHPVGDGAGGFVSVSNKGTKQLSCASMATAQASFGAARTAMKKFKNDDGQPLNINPTVLLVPPALGDTARLLAGAEKFANGDMNPYRGTVEVVEDARLTSDTAWFLLDCSKPIKPFIYQERKAPVFVSQTDMQADGVFMRRKFLFGAEARAAAGYGFWQMAYGSDGTVA